MGATSRVVKIVVGLAASACCLQLLPLPDSRPALFASAQAPSRDVRPRPTPAATPRVRPPTPPRTIRREAPPGEILPRQAPPREDRADPQPSRQFPARSAPPRRTASPARTTAPARELGERSRDDAPEDPFTDKGDYYAGLDQYEEAVKFYERALAFHAEHDNAKGEAEAHNNLARAFYALGRYERVAEHAASGLDAARGADDRAAEADSLNLLGLVQHALGRYEQAVGYYNRALRIVGEQDNRVGHASLLNNVGESLRLAGQFDKALVNLREALSVLRSGGRDRLSGGFAGSRRPGASAGESAARHHRKTEGLILDSLGATYYGLGQYDKAVEHLTLALAAHREVKNRFDEGVTLNNLGRTHLSAGRHDEAVGHFKQALNINREVGSRKEEGVSQSGLMSSFAAKGSPRLAVFYGKQAVNAFQAIRTNIRRLDQETRRGFLRSTQDAYRALADLLVTQDRLPEAQQVLAMLKEEEFFEFVRRDGGEAAALTARAALTADESALEADYGKLADEVTRLGRERGELFAKGARTPEEEQSLTLLEDRLAVAADHFQKFLEQLEAKLGRATAQGARVNEIRDALGMQKTLRELGDGTVLLYTLAGEDRYRVMLVTPDTQQAYENPAAAADLARKVLAFREALRDPRQDPAPLARELYNIIVGPKLARDLKQAGARTLMWSLDGPLRYLPVAALQDEGRKYLVESYRNVIFTPASRDRLKDPVGARWQGLGLGVSKGKEVALPGVSRRLAFSALPGVPQELRSIIRDRADGETAASGAGVLEGTVMLDGSFTKDSLRAALRRKYPLVHIASHFMFQPGNDADSFLLLGGDDEQSNKLTVAEIKRLSFEGVELLTLSACDTAMGGERAGGAEVESFGVLAQRQGAGAVMATLWPVADASTPLLMREFYRLREAAPGTTKAEALRQAQLALLGGRIKPEHAEEQSRGLGLPRASATSFSHPFYWAPFILIGNWR